MSAFDNLMACQFIRFLVKLAIFIVTFVHSSFLFFCSAMSRTPERALLTSGQRRLAPGGGSKSDAYVPKGWDPLTPSGLSTSPVVVCPVFWDIA